MAYCSNCGNQLPDEGNVCSNCNADYIINLQQLPQNVVIVQSTKKKIGYFDLWVGTIIVAISYGLMSNNVCGSSLSPFFSDCGYWKAFNWALEHWALLLLSLV
ncbi:MAG: zinc ribbon domain-containing protein [Euryarchaeota archaeon]|nr:zinc ribbon domain-containing protein [Euryarchaeota archaeon]